MNGYQGGFPHVRHADGWELVDQLMPVPLGAELPPGAVTYTDAGGPVSIGRTIVWVDEMGRSPLLVRIERGGLPPGALGRTIAERVSDAYATWGCEVELV